MFIITERNKAYLSNISDAGLQEDTNTDSSKKFTSDNATVHPEFNNLDRSAKLNSIISSHAHVR